MIWHTPLLLEMECVPGLDHQEESKTGRALYSGAEAAKPGAGAKGADAAAREGAGQHPRGHGRRLPGAGTPAYLRKIQITSVLYALVVECLASLMVRYEIKFDISYELEL